MLPKFTEQGNIRDNPQHLQGKCLKCPILQAALDTKELERLRNSESLLRLLVDSLPAFVSYIDCEQKYVFANALYAEFFGLGTRPAGLHVSKVLGDEAYLKVRAHIEAALRGERQSYEYDLPHGGKLRHLKALYIPHMERGKVKGIIVLGIDVVERKQMERELAEQP
jgi:PAS domain S-box-containing protein